MKMPSTIINEAIRVSHGNTELRRFFLMGAEYALHGTNGIHKGNEEMVLEPAYPLQQALDIWLQYKAEKKQRYKPIGLRSLKKKLFQLSGGNPEYAMQIVEFSMANNYTGLFPPKDNIYERQQNTVRKVADILNG